MKLLLGASWLLNILSCEDKSRQFQFQEEKRNLRSKAVPHYGVPFQPQYQHKITEPAPFGFEEREKMKAELKAKKIEQVLEEEARVH